MLISLFRSNALKIPYKAHYISNNPFGIADGILRTDSYFTSVASVFDFETQTTVGLGADLRALFLRMIKKTIPFKIPPMFVNEVTSRNIAKGTFSAIMPQIPFTAAAHHWMKNTNTNKDIFLAACVDFLSEFAFFPIVPSSLFVSVRIFDQVRE